MMEISLEHGYHGHFILIKSGGMPCSDYFLKVIKENQVQGLLPVTKRNTEEGVVYAYEITGRESLKKRWKVCSLSYRDVKDILVQLTETVKRSEEYLLGSDKILLDPEVMFQENGRLMLCYYPEKQTGFYEAFRGFAEQMIKEVDHHDAKGMTFAYDLYDACQEDTFVLENYLKESWQRETPVREEKASVVIEEPAVQKVTKKKRGLSSLFGKNKRKKREQIRQEIWTEVWKLKGKQEFIVDKSPFVIGKQMDGVDACIENRHVSRLHAKLEQERGLVFLSDLNSTNGTFINGRKILEGKKELLSPGDRISFADEVFLFVKEERY